MQISIICANDSMELAFPPDTTDAVIKIHRLRIKDKMDKQHPQNNVFIHEHVVELFDPEKETTNGT